METTISDDELAARLADVLERVRTAGERFLVERDGQPIATIAPLPGKPSITGREQIARLGDLQMPGDGFADDLEAIQAEQRIPVFPEWPD